MTRLLTLILACASVLAHSAAAADEDIVEGIDVSHHQGEIDWTKVKNDGIVFAFMKATQGLRFVDPRFKLNWAATEKAGIIRGAYHFLEADQDGAAQAKHFMKTVDFTKGDLIPGRGCGTQRKGPCSDTQGVSCRGEGHPRGRCRHLRVTVVLERTPCECIRDRPSQPPLGRGVRRDHAEGRPEHGTLARLAVHQIGKGRWRFRPGGPESSEDDHWHPPHSVSPRLVIPPFRGPKPRYRTLEK